MRIQRYIVMEATSGFTAMRVSAEPASIDARVRDLQQSGLYENVIVTAEPDIILKELEETARRMGSTLSQTLTKEKS